MLRLSPFRVGTEIYFYSDSYENIEAVADCFLLATDADNIHALIANVNRWVSTKGYKKLVKSGDENAYRLARIANGAEIMTRLNRLSSFSITFDCKPQRFLLTGETPIEVLESGQAINNAGIGGLPLIKVYGTSGDVSVNGYSISINTIDEYLTIDCDLQDAYKDTVNRNAYISCSEFPKLQAGENVVIFSEGIEKVEITPRWYTL